MQTENSTRLENLKFNPSFFEDEVREGFFISSMMKRYWAAELTVLAEIDRICRKHDIPWFADCGTLLGAVRHGGFIPWDDDLDICMLRSDYIRFHKILKNELPAGWCVLNIHTEKEYTSMLSRIVNAHEINTNEDHLRLYHGCPYTVGIDIFPLDDLCPDQALEAERVDQLLMLSRAIDLILLNGIDAPETKKILSTVEATHHTVLHRRGPILQELRLLVEKLYTRYSSDEAEHVALMPYWVKYHDHKYEKRWFADRAFLPFENTLMPVPCVYNDVLRVEYGDFMQVHKGGGVHSYPVYGDQEAILREKNDNKNPYRYTMEKTSLLARKNPPKFRDYSLSIIDTLIEAHKALSSGNAVSLLTECQSLAITLGNALEKEYPRETELVHFLENYCETAYNLSVNWADHAADALNAPILAVKEGLVRLFNEKKKLILFLPCKAAWWPAMEPVWEKVRNDPSSEVIVMPVPYAQADLFGSEPGRRVDDHAGFPSYVPLTRAEDFDIAAHHPDTIYIQYPFDEWSTSLQVPAFFYSENLHTCTDRLVYVPCFVPEDPIDENDKAVAAIRVLIEQPAVLHTDQVLLPSEKMRALYQDTLTELSGGNAAYWDEKLVVERSFASCKGLRHMESLCPGKKTLLFHIDLSLLLSYRSEAIRKLRSVQGTVEEFESQIICLFAPGRDLNELGSIDPGLWKEYRRFEEGLKESKVFQFVEEQDALEKLPRISAYYGTPGVLAHRSREMGLPVMLLNVEV